MIPTVPGLVLGIESSCDETCAAVLRGQTVLSSVVATQIEMHQKWGGVVPEAAARAHLESLLPVVEEAVREAGVTLGDLSGIAVTNRPGLVGALSVGVTAAKGLAMVLGVPFVGVHHLEGHLLSPFLLALGTEDSAPVAWPMISLIASGGHTELVLMQSPGVYEIVAETLDDAAGEAFDKGARLLGLGYPGGRAIQELAVSGDPKAYPLPRSVAQDPTHFSFSGLKTAVLRRVEKDPDLNPADLAASLQAAVVDSLTSKTVEAAEAHGARSMGLVGGVAANSALRSRMQVEADRLGVPLFVPETRFCTDNAAMIALAGSFRLSQGQFDDFGLDVFPNSPLP
jgi:N6-L-threonylcarbamoyladenine synthase